MKKLIYLILLFSFSFQRCEEKTDFELANNGLNVLVVEGVLTNEQGSQMIRLSHPHSQQNGDAIPASGATVAVSDGTSTYPLSEKPIGSGEYYTDSTFRALFDQLYTLTINYQGRQYTAEDASKPVEALTAFQLEQSITLSDTLYSILMAPEGDEPSYTVYSIDWSGTSRCKTPACQAELIYYDLKTIDVHEIYKPDKEDLLFPAGSTIVRKKYSMSDNYRSFLRSLLSETEWRGGIFDIERANAPTNLSEGAIGFFAISTMVSDTLKIQ